MEETGKEPYVGGNEIRPRKKRDGIRRVIYGEYLEKKYPDPGMRAILSDP